MAHGDLSSDSIIDCLSEAESLKMAGEYKQALVILEELLISDPDNVTALEEVAENELNLGHAKRAEKAARRAIRLDEKSYTAHYVMGFLHTRSGSWQDALPSLKIANRLHPNNPEILRCLGSTLFQSGNHVEGVVTLERTLNINPDDPLTLCDLGVAYLHLGNIRKAQSLFECAFVIDPQNSRVAECMRSLKQLREKSGAAR